MKARIGNSVIDIDPNRVRGGGAEPAKRALPVTQRTGARPLQVSNPAPSPAYKSKLEASYANYLNGLKLAGDIQLYRYEPVRLRLTDDLSYVPDFYVILKDGTEEWHEVKPHTKRILSREGRVKVRMAASQWPSWKFVEVERVRGVWEQRELSA